MELVEVTASSDGEISEAEYKRVMDDYNIRLVANFRKMEREREIAIHRAFGMPETLIQKLYGTD